MKKLLAILLAALMVFCLVACGGNDAANDNQDDAGNNQEEVLKVGFIYIGDESDEGWTYNHIVGQREMEAEYEGKIQSICKYNVPEDSSVIDAIDELASEGCTVIFATSFGYEQFVQEVVEDYPEVTFCHCSGYQCAGDNYENTNNYFAEIYEGRYLAGVIAGLKLNEMIENGDITAEEAKVGYVGAYPFAEVISGYTAWYLGVASVCPSVTMDVVYANTWGDYETEYQCALSLIDNGCVLISQHSDTTGPAAACETAEGVFHVGYNTDMTDVAPTSTLVSSHINWGVFVTEAVGKILNGEAIKSDNWGGIADGWVSLVGINEDLLAEGTLDMIENLKAQLADGTLQIFFGDYTGTNSNGDTIDLSAEAYIENATQSAPAYDFVLDDVITIVG